MSLADDIKQTALQLGFDLVGITDAAPIDQRHTAALQQWLEAGFAGQMQYMHRNLDKRINPAKLLAGANSVICVGLNYKPPQTKPNAPPEPVPTGRVANFALYEDYHVFIKKRLFKLAQFINMVTDNKTRLKICVDSAPVAERALAARAGLGFIGKNHMLINPELGPQILLGEIITDLELEADKQIADSCAGCDKCIAACPAGALRNDGRFDANKCVSYLTIEYKGKIPAELADKIGDRLFGCDECTRVCPFSANGPVCSNADFKFYPERAKPALNEVLNLTGPGFEKKFANSCIERIGPEILARNAHICLANNQ